MMNKSLATLMPSAPPSRFRDLWTVKLARKAMTARQERGRSTHTAAIQHPYQIVLYPLIAPEGLDGRVGKTHCGRSDITSTG